MPEANAFLHPTFSGVSGSVGMSYWLRVITGTILLLATAHCPSPAIDHSAVQHRPAGGRHPGVRQPPGGIRSGGGLPTHRALRRGGGLRPLPLRASVLTGKLQHQFPYRLATQPARTAFARPDGRFLNGGVRFSWPLRHITPYIGAEGSTNRITAAGYGLKVSRRYWGVAPVVGVEVSVAPRWSLRADTRLQTIFIEEDIPFVEDIIDETLMFVPLQVGVVYRLNLRQP